jgi:cobalt-zinc-cadmium efflux system protein
MVSLGVVVSGVIIKFTNWFWLDGAVSIVVLVIILIGTWSLLTASLRLSMDAVPENIEMSAIEKVIKKVKGVESIHHMHIWAMSTTENALTTHLVLNDALSFDEKMKVVHNIKHELQHQNIQHATIELESAAMPCADEEC